MVPWSFLSISLNDSAVCIIANEGLIRKIYLPKLVFPLSRVLIGLVTFIFSLGAMFLLLWPLGARPSLSMLFLPVVIGLFTIFITRPEPDRRHGQHVLPRLRPPGLGVLAGVVFRHADHLSGRWRHFPESARWMFRLNPAFYFVELFHDVLYSGQWPRLGMLAMAAVIAAVSLGVGYAIFKSHEDKMVFRL